MPRPWIAATLLVALAACGGAKPRTAAPPPPPPASAPAADADQPLPDCAPQNELPPVPFAERSIPESALLVKRGMDDYDAQTSGKSFPEKAAALEDNLRAALAADPYNLWAHYWLINLYASLARRNCTLILLQRFAQIAVLPSQAAAAAEIRKSLAQSPMLARYYGDDEIRAVMRDADIGLDARGSKQDGPKPEYKLALLPDLPAVPAADDAPAPHVDAPAAKPKAAIKARVIEAIPSGGGTRITLSRGSKDGVAKGMKGALVDAKGKSLHDGGFVVAAVKPNESTATVKAAAADVNNAKDAVIRP